jgi:hypothetical protein
MATLPVMGYVVGGALSTAWWHAARRVGGARCRSKSGLLVAVLSCAVAAWAIVSKDFWLLVGATVVAGYYSANGQLYRFAAAELALPAVREKSRFAGTGRRTDWRHCRAELGRTFAGLVRGALRRGLHRTGRGGGGGYGADGLGALSGAPARLPTTGQWQWRAPHGCHHAPARIFGSHRRCGARLRGHESADGCHPMAMQQCGLGFDDAALVLQWHVIGMFAPGFFTGNWIKRFGVLSVMGVGVLLNLACIAIALTGVELHQFAVALFLLGVGWNFLFTGSTTLSLGAYRPEEKDRAQAAINFWVFVVMALTSFASGALVSTQGLGDAELGFAGASGADGSGAGMAGPAPAHGRVSGLTNAQRGREAHAI